MKRFYIFQQIFKIENTFDFTIWMEDYWPENDRIIYRETFLENWEIGQLMGGN
jgi:hypothetical protein